MVWFARVAAAAVLLAVGGCTIVVGDGTSPDAATSPSVSASPSTDPNTTVTRSLKDVERFWTATFSQISNGRTFTPVQGGYHPYTKTKPPPACGPEQPQYQPNAFYCPDGDFIAWDAQTLIPQLQQNFGPLLIGVVLAHEYGHAIQTRPGIADQPTVVLEQQADCFAGAWLADVQAGRSTAFGKPTAKELDNTVAGLLVLRDQPGTSATEQGAHGNAFDRIRALQDGVETGVTTCARYRTDSIPVTEVPFQTQTDAATGGNLSYSDAIADLSADAQAYWRLTYPQLAPGQSWPDLRVQAFDPQSPPACAKPDQSAGEAAFACPAANFVAFDSAQLGPRLYRNLGDNAVGMLIGDLFARTAQDRRGASTQDRAGQLTVDCLAGSWTNSQLQRQPGQDALTLSPGDLDEAVGALLAIGRAGNESGPSAFDRIAAYRNGVLNGLTACSS